MTTTITKLMTLAEAQDIMKTQRLVFGDSTQIEALELIELAKKAEPLGSFKRRCEECRFSSCAVCGMYGYVKVLLAGPTAEKLTAKDFREALGRR